MINKPKLTSPKLSMDLAPSRELNLNRQDTRRQERISLK